MPDPIRFTSEAERASRNRRRREQKQRQIRRRRRIALGGAVVLVAVIVIAAFGLSGSSGKGVSPDASASAPKAAADKTNAGKAGASKQTPSKYLTCKDPSTKGALHVTGNKLLDSTGKVFVPYGVTTYGGMEYIGDDAWKIYQPQVIAQINAAHRYWHANTVRLQVGEGNVFNNGVVKDGVNKSVLKLLCDQVQLVRSEGMEAVISDQTEWPDWNERLPTARTVAFWKVIASVFKDQPGISFDLYNEPRIYYPKPEAEYNGHPPALDADWIWSIWLHGGHADAQNFVGMQTLFNDVRRTAPENVIWVEGPFFDNTLGLAGKYAMHGTNMVWSVHHPALSSSTDWAENFGYLTSKYPVVDGEWGQYAAARPECRAAAYTMVPKYLAYLREHNIGVLGWSLQPGAMLADPDGASPSNYSVSGDTANPADLATPSQMSSNYACTNSELGQGAGQLLMNEFKEYSTPAP